MNYWSIAWSDVSRRAQSLNHLNRCVACFSNNNWIFDMKLLNLLGCKCYYTNPSSHSTKANNIELRHQAYAVNAQNVAKTSIDKRLHNVFTRKLELFSILPIDVCHAFNPYSVSYTFECCKCALNFKSSQQSGILLIPIQMCLFYSALFRSFCFTMVDNSIVKHNNTNSSDIGRDSIVF